MSDRPRLKPWLRPIRRQDDEVQLGIDEHGIILTGIDAAEFGLLCRLDGTLTRAQTFDAARGVGVPARRWREVLDLLRRLDLLAPDPATSARVRRAHVVVDGVSPMSNEIALLLGRSGIRRISHGRPAVDVVLADPQGDRPDLVLIVGTDALDPRCGDVWRHHHVTHVPVVPLGPATSIGPVVGRDPHGPCLWCVDLHRADRDDGWPEVVTQVARQSMRLVPPVAEPDSIEAGLVPFVAGGVVLLALGLLAGESPPPGIALEVRAPWPRVDHRCWTRHPRCRRHDAAAVVA
jgi:hypothetical protein